MKEFKIDNKGSGRLFSSNLLERMTRTHFAIPVVLYLLIAIYFIFYVSSQYSVPLLTYLMIVPLGVLTFTFVEYLIHRFLFHFHATTESQLRLQYNIHGVHHEFPRDKYRLVMPPLISVFIAGLFLLLFYMLFDEIGLILFTGFISGYSLYLLIHYAVHALKPPKNFLKVLWKHHSLHHYASVQSAFSVSFPLWDVLFGTMPSMEERKKAEKLSAGNKQPF